MKKIFKSSGVIFLIGIITLVLATNTSSLSKRDDVKESIIDKEKTQTQIVIDGKYDFVNVFADIAEKTTQSVVSVIPTQIDTVVYRQNPFYSSSPDAFFEHFFNRGRPQRPRNNQKPQVEKREQRREGLGSGVIVSDDGYILTNYHVVNGADELKIKLNDGREYDAEIVGSDSLSDVSVLKIKGDVKGIHPIKLGNSAELRPGDWSIAIGNPFSLTSSVTVGIVSALGRQVQQGAYQNFIQTDAAINPGNSGGALLNIKGELIGINTMIFSKAGGFNGIGFAVPVNMAKKIMDDIKEHGKVLRGWIGVTIQDISPTTREAMDLDKITGTLIASVSKDQPADKAGIKAGDIVIKIDGDSIRDANHLKLKVAELTIGKKYNFTIFRDGELINLKVKINDREKALQVDENTNSKEDDLETYKTNLGLTLKETKKGVEIIELDNEQYNVKRYLKIGDVISSVKVSGKKKIKIESIETFEKVIKNVKKGRSILFEIDRNGSKIFVSFRV